MSLKSEMNAAMATIDTLLESEIFPLHEFDLNALLVVAAKRANWIQSAETPDYLTVLSNYLKMRDGDDELRFPLVARSESDMKCIRIALEGMKSMCDMQLARFGHWALILYRKDGKIGPYLANGDRGDFVRLFTEMLTRDAVGEPTQPIESAS